MFIFSFLIQLQLANHICSLTFEKEKVGQEEVFLKFGVLFKKLPKSLDQMEHSLPTSITTLSDPIIRERLSKEYQRIIQQAKEDLTSVLTRASEAKKIDCQKNFDRETAEIWKTQHQLPIHERLTSRMLALIEQRQKNIIECIKCIYILKDDFFRIVPTTTITN